MAAYTTCYISIIETEKAITFHYVWHFFEVLQNKSYTVLEENIQQ